MTIVQYRKVTGSTKFLKPAEFKQGDVVIDGATFMGTEQGKFGPILVFTKQGNRLVIGCSGQLKYASENGQFKTGDVVRLTYNGKKKLKNGKDAHDYIIEVAEAAPSNDAQESLGF